MLFASQEVPDSVEVTTHSVDRAAKKEDGAWDPRWPRVACDGNGKEGRKEV
jgi:hypothetical protein